MSEPRKERSGRPQKKGGRPAPGKASGQFLDEEASKTKQQHLSSLKTLQEMFPDWAEEDLVGVLQDTHGDLELAVQRITEGLANTWGQVKKKAPRKERDDATTEKHFDEAAKSTQPRRDRAERGQGKPKSTPPADSKKRNKDTKLTASQVVAAATAAVAATSNSSGHSDTSSSGEKAPAQPSKMTWAQILSQPTPAKPPVPPQSVSNESVDDSPATKISKAPKGPKGPKSAAPIPSGATAVDATTQSTTDTEAAPAAPKKMTWAEVLAKPATPEPAPAAPIAPADEASPNTEAQSNEKESSEQAAKDVNKRERRRRNKKTDGTRVEDVTQQVAAVDLVDKASVADTKQTGSADVSTSQAPSEPSAAKSQPVATASSASSGVPQTLQAPAQAPQAPAQAPQAPAQAPQAPASQQTAQPQGVAVPHMGGAYDYNAQQYGYANQYGYPMAQRFGNYGDLSGYDATQQAFYGAPQIPGQPPMHPYPHPQAGQPGQQQQQQDSLYDQKNAGTAPSGIPTGASPSIAHYGHPGAPIYMNPAYAAYYYQNYAGYAGPGAPPVAPGHQPFGGPMPQQPKNYGGYYDFYRQPSAQGTTGTPGSQVPGQADFLRHDQTQQQQYYQYPDQYQQGGWDYSK